MKLTYRYKLRPTKEQNATMIEWLNLCRRQYNYRLGQRLRWWSETRTPINSCPLNVSVVPVEKIYQDIREFRVQVRDGRKLGKDGLPITKKGDKHPNIVGGYVQWSTVQLGDLKNTKKLFPEYKKIHSQVLQDVINRVETGFSNFINPDKNGNRAGKPKFKGLHYYKSFTYSQLKNKHISDNQVDLSGIGKVDFVQHRPIPVLEWVASKLGKRVIKIDPWRTSQICCSCLNLVPKSLSDRWHSCPCGIEINRDENSARLQKSVGLGLDLRKIAPPRERSLPRTP